MYKSIKVLSIVCGVIVGLVFGSSLLSRTASGEELKLKDTQTIRDMHHVTDVRRQQVDKTLVKYFSANLCLYRYSEWGDCQANGMRHRLVLDQFPDNCMGTPVTKETCPTVSCDAMACGSLYQKANVSYTGPFMGAPTNAQELINLCGEDCYVCEATGELTASCANGFTSTSVGPSGYQCRDMVYLGCLDANASPCYDNCSPQDYACVTACAEDAETVCMASESTQPKSLPNPNAACNEADGFFYAGSNVEGTYLCKSNDPKLATPCREGCGTMIMTSGSMVACDKNY